MVHFSTARRFCQLAIIAAAAAFSVPAMAQQVDMTAEADIAEEMDMPCILGGKRQVSGAPNQERKADLAMPELPLVYEPEGPASQAAPVKPTKF
jgi:hypothetical protein